MKYIVFSLLIFVLSIFLHVLWCRVRGAKDLQINAFVFLSLGGLFVFLIYQPSSKEIASFWHAPLNATSAVLYFLLIPVYLIFYFGMNVESPSRRILLLIAENKELTIDEILVHLTNEMLITPRLNDLHAYGFVKMKGDKFILTDSGLRTAGMLSVYQKLLGRGKGG